jgi:starvation-inducible DNA-binding protein
MHPTRNNLPEAKRRELIGLMNERLADAIDLEFQARHAHWNVKGPAFLSLHELFEKLAGEISGQIDDLAERITALGGVAEGTIRHAVAKTNLPAWPEGVVSGRDHLTAIADALARFGKDVRAAIDESESLGDKDSADLFTGLSRAADKQLWLVEAHLQSDR